MLRPATAVATQASSGAVGPPAAASGDRIALAAICVATFAYVGVESAVTLFVADHARSDLGLDAARAAGTISAFWGGLLFGRLGVGFAPRAPGAGTTAALSAVATLIVFGFGRGWITPPELAMAGTGFFLGGVFPVMIGLAGQALPHRTGLAVGLAGGLGSLGGFAVPWLTGGLAGTGGLARALAALSGWLLLLVAGAAFARHRRVMVRA
jgi:fucose permease